MQVAIRDVEANVEVVGAGRAVVFLHGAPADHRQMMLTFEPAFEAHPGWQRVYPDLPGMGASPAPSWITNVDDIVQWCHELIDAVVGSIGRFTLAGASFGGYLALRLLEPMADRIDGLFLHVPAVRLEPDARRRPARRVIRPADDALVAALAPDDRPWLDVSVVQTAETLDFFRRGPKLGRAAADMAFLDRLEGPADASGGPGGTIPARPFDGPSLILAGRQDHLVGYADAVDLLEILPRATLAILDRAGHGLAAEQPRLLHALVGEWLGRVEEP